MTTDTVSETGSPQRNRRPNRVLSFLRNTWRGLTSMRTALILLFLLALATMPGALLPQHSLNESKTQTYISEHGWWGRLLDATGFLNVYSSVWFAAIYLLLMISLVGCLLPRSVEHARQLRDKPVLVPRNFNRLPHKASATVTVSPEEVVASARPLLRGWRIAERSEDGGVRTISAEKGFLREVGNLMFHFALLGLIVSVALGSMFSYKGQVAVIADGSQFCNSGPLAYDAFTPGPRVDGTNLAPFCVKVNDFTARYLANRQPTQYESNVEYQSGKDLRTGQWRPYHLEVNDPLRVAGDRVYLLDHGYAPTVTVTYPNGEKRTQTQVFRPTEVSTYFSEGAVKFTETPGITDPVEQRKKQLAVTGLFAPTAAMQGKLLAGSTNPELRDPVFAADVYQGDLGVDSGKGQSIYEIDHQMIAQNRLHRVDRVNLKPGQQTKLGDGTTVRFDGVKKFASLEIAHDPTQVWVLVFAIALLLGLFGSLVIKRRRVWLRAKPTADGSTLITVGALARTDQAGYGEEFTKLSRALLTATRGKDD
ncbi:cytochrome c biogenesis protein ResB [Sciscionella sediminilitoris]|uniref:cytochrome c biogenesis protein ResB n=1 Tax=Sciscionella sediminilitoris TaxID=1445613 RepID=UPI0004DF8EE1|nr:cytochrome c biogenesis protein ResB [Sciscionella sp. SE31]